MAKEIKFNIQAREELKKESTNWQTPLKSLSVLRDVM